MSRLGFDRPPVEGFGRLCDGNDVGNGFLNDAHQRVGAGKVFYLRLSPEMYTDGFY